MSEQKKATLVVGADSDVGARLISQLTGPVIAHYFVCPEKLDGLAGDIMPVMGDLSGVAGIEAFIEAVIAQGYSIEKIVHLPSAPAVAGRIKNLDPEAFLRELHISLISAAMVCRAFVPTMAKQRFGRVVFMLTSYIVGVPPKFLATYVSCKYALEGLMKALAVEFAGKGVTVNGVAPYMMETKFLSNVADLTVQQSAHSNPTGRNATIDDVLPSILLLLDDKNEFTTGAVIPIAGGSTF